MSHLTEHNLHSIEDYIHEGQSTYFIAHALHRHVSVISRLFERYPRTTFAASEVILARSRLHAECTKHHARIMRGGVLEEFIITHIKRRYSPEQVAGAWVEQQWRFR